MQILTTLEECSVPEYSLLVDSLRRTAKGVDGLRVVALTGEVSATSSKHLGSIVDEVKSFFDFEIYRKLRTVDLGHPVGKYAKLFLALEYLNSSDAPASEVVLFLDPDTFVQKPLRALADLARSDMLLFGHELELVHTANSPSDRLAVAHRFDKPGAWHSSYFVEVNTGVTLGTVASFRRVVADFARFTEKTGYYTEALPRLENDFWHDQDFFRYFLRKALPVDVGVLGLDLVFTTIGSASRCLRFEPKLGRFVTSWGVQPHVLHFAGVTLGKVAGVPTAWVPQRDPTPAWARPRPSIRETVKRMLGVSPLDVARSVRRRFGA
jgi:hypothetical protein